VPEIEHKEEKDGRKIVKMLPSLISDYWKRSILDGSAMGGT